MSAGLGPAHGYALITITHGLTLRAAAGIVLIALLALGVATRSGTPAVAIGAALALLYLPRRMTDGRCSASPPADTVLVDQADRR